MRTSTRLILFSIVLMTAIMPRLIFALTNPGSPQLQSTQGQLVNSGLAQDQAAQGVTPTAVKPKATAGAAGGTAAATSASVPFQFSNEGIFGCSTNVGQSVGAEAAVGGVYVPVNDAAVTINTSLVVYKTCILDPLTRKIAENITAGISKLTIQKLDQGRGGQKMYVQKPDPETKTVAGDPAELAALTQIKNMASLGPNRAKIVQILVKNYTDGTDRTKILQNLACPYGDMTDFEKNANYSGTSFFEDFRKSTDPRCYPSGQKYLLERYALDNVTAKQADLRQSWDWGRGFYPVQQIDGDHFTTVTPAAYVEENGLQAIQSGFRQAENVDSIGEMTTALFSGLAEQIVSDSRGLAGLIQAAGNQPSYLNQMTAETGAGVRQQASIAGGTVLTAQYRRELDYLKAVKKRRDILTGTISQLRNAEKQCWVLLVPRVTAFAAAPSCTTVAAPGATTGAFGGVGPAATTQTCTGGFQLDPNKIALSTSSQQFSKAVIDAQITPLLTPIQNNIITSTTNVHNLEQLSAAISTVTSLDAHRLAIQQLETLISNNALRTGPDVTAAQQDVSSTKDTMTTLVLSTIGDATHPDGWTNSLDTNEPPTGWCNYNNPSTVSYWANLWKQ